MPPTAPGAAISRAVEQFAAAAVPGLRESATVVLATGAACVECEHAPAASVVVASALVELASRELPHDVVPEGERPLVGLCHANIPVAGEDRPQRVERRRLDRHAGSRRQTMRSVAVGFILEAFLGAPRISRGRRLWNTAIVPLQLTRDQRRKHRKESIAHPLREAA